MYPLACCLSIAIVHKFSCELTWKEGPNTAGSGEEPMSEITIRAATVDDIPTLILHRRMMWWDMGRHDEAALDLERFHK